MGLLNFLEHPIQGVRGLLGAYGQPQDGGDYFDQNLNLIGNGGDASRPYSGGVKYAPPVSAPAQSVASPTGLSALFKIPGALTGAILNDLQSGPRADAMAAQRQADFQKAIGQLGFAGQGAPQIGPDGAPQPGGQAPSLRAAAPIIAKMQAAGYKTADIVSLLDKISPHLSVANGVTFDDRNPSGAGQKIGTNLTNVNDTLVDTQDTANANRTIPKVGNGQVVLYDANRNPIAVQDLAGNIQSIQKQAQAQAAGTEAGKAPFDLVTVQMPDGSTVQMPRSAAIAALQGGGSPGASAVGRGPAPGGLGRSQSPADAAYQGDAAKAAASRFADIQKQGQNAPKLKQQYQAIDQLLGDFEGGKLTPAMLATSSALNSLGFHIDPNLPKAQAASALSNQIVLTMMNGSLGTGISNADRDFITAQAPTLVQSAQGRKTIIQMAVKAADNQAQQANFARQWQARYGRLDAADSRGVYFDDQWTKWLENHPLLPMTDKRPPLKK